MCKLLLWVWPCLLEMCTNSEKYLSLVSCVCSSFSCLCCQNIYLSNMSFVHLQLTINYILGGRFVSIKYHIQSPVLYMIGHLSFSFVKDTFFSHGLLQFIEYNVNWKTNIYLCWDILTQTYSLKHHSSRIIHKNQKHWCK